MKPTEQLNSAKLCLANPHAKETQIHLFVRSGEHFPIARSGQGRQQLAYPFSGSILMQLCSSAARGNLRARPRNGRYYMHNARYIERECIENTLRILGESEAALMPLRLVGYYDAHVGWLAGFLLVFKGIEAWLAQCVVVGS